MSYEFVDSEDNRYQIAYLDASALGGMFFDGLFLTIKAGKLLDVRIEAEFKEGFMAFNEEYWIKLAKDYIANDIDFLTFLSEPNNECENELYLEFIENE